MATKTTTGSTGTAVAAGTFLVLLVSGVGSLCVIVVPRQPLWGWWTVLSGLVVTAVLAMVASQGLLQAPPAGRQAKLWLARGHQICAVLLMGLGIRGVDGWWNTPAAERPPMWLAFVGLAALGYLSVRLGMTATFLKPSGAREIPSSPSPPSSAA